mgnify:CR=1 FL=1
MWKRLIEIGRAWPGRGVTNGQSVRSDVVRRYAFRAAASAACRTAGRELRAGTLNCRRIASQTLDDFVGERRLDAHLAASPMNMFFSAS